jgi:sigma-E factor negative regulatory protein RseA
MMSDPQGRKNGMLDMKAAAGTPHAVAFGQQSPERLIGQQKASPEVAAHACSALIDSDLGEHEWAVLWAEDPSGERAHEVWHTYQVIGDALRGESVLKEMTPAPVFLAEFRSRLQRELAAYPQGHVQPSAAAKPAQVAVEANLPRVAAANDASFRWKMVAMAASVTAVMAVSWGVLVGGDGAAAVSPQLAEAPAVPVAQPQIVAAEPVIVQTGQGPLIRDARLESLLAEHRQYGGMSALQMPAGFLRNATYDAHDR